MAAYDWQWAYCTTHENKLTSLVHFQLIFTDVSNRRVYKTDDEGQTFHRNQGEKLDFTPDRLLFHPTRENYVLGYTYEERKVCT